MIGAFGFGDLGRIHGVTYNKDNVYIAYETSHGSGELIVGNTLTDIGENQTRTRMSTNGTYVYVGWISLGNATVAVTLTQLTTEYTRYKALEINDQSYASHSSFNITQKYTFTETVWLNCVGAQWATSGDNNLYAAAYLQVGGGYLQWNANDNITITWVFTYSY